MSAGSPFKLQTSHGTVRVAARAEVEDSPAWRASFDGHRQDHRYYRIVEDTSITGTS
jgi:hypothetical protein